MNRSTQAKAIVDKVKKVIEKNIGFNQLHKILNILIRQN